MKASPKSFSWFENSLSSSSSDAMLLTGLKRASKLPRRSSVCLLEQENLPTSGEAWPFS
uniref:Uncharacterized protein n=1 Tax=Rhizophora mucronata TaxID=61149 RepID=A0A2P2N2T5_RHIMU